MHDRHTDRVPDFIGWLTAGFDVFMQLARLFLDYLKVLAWPSVVLILVLVYKRPIIGVLARLRKATGPGVALELDARELAEAAQEIAAVEATTTTTNSETTASPPEPAGGERTDATVLAPVAHDTGDPRRDPGLLSFDALYKQLRARHPENDLHYDPEWGTARATNANSAIILSAWASVVEDAAAVADVLGVPNGQWSVPVITNILVQRGYVSSPYEGIARRLQTLRNTVSRGLEPPTEDVVVDFLSTSLVIREQLQRGRRRAALDQSLQRVTPSETDAATVPSDPPVQD